MLGKASCGVLTLSVVDQIYWHSVGLASLSLSTSRLMLGHDSCCHHLLSSIAIPLFLSDVGFVIFSTTPSQHWHEVSSVEYIRQACERSIPLLSVAYFYMYIVLVI